MSESKPLYLVTGAAGFVGMFMVELLRSKDIAVRAMVRKPEQAAKLEKLGAEVVIGDLTDAESLKAAVLGVAGIYHIAALFRVAGLPEAVFEDINATGTKRLLDAAIEAGVPRLIHCSTVGVHGHIENPPATEEAPFTPGDMYQRTKLAGEKIAMEYFAEGKIKGAVIRPAMIYGPGDERTLKLFKMIGKGKFFYVGKGLATIHFIDVRDLARSFLLAMEHTEINNEVYIISGAKAMPLKHMCEIVASQLGVKPPWIHLPVKPMQWLGTLCEVICTPLKINPPIFRRRVDFFTKSRDFDSTKARNQLGFIPERSFEEEIKDILDSYKALNIL